MSGVQGVNFQTRGPLEVTVSKGNSSSWVTKLSSKRIVGNLLVFEWPARIGGRQYLGTLLFAVVMTGGDGSPSLTCYRLSITVHGRVWQLTALEYMHQHKCQDEEELPCSALDPVAFL